MTMLVTHGAWLQRPAACALSLHLTNGLTLPLAGEEPFSFTTALRPHFACDDLSQRPEFVRILGLGGKWTYDYENPYHPKLGTGRVDV